MKFHFPVIVIDEDFRSENASGLGIRALAKAIEDEGIEVIGVTTYSGEREGTVTEEMGSLQSRDKCERLNPDAQRECLINDKAG